MTPPKSSEDHDKFCGGKTKAGGTCKRPAGWGTGHLSVGRCKLHMGRTPNHEKRGQMEKAQQASKLLGVAVQTNPFESLMQLEAEAMGYVEYFRRKVQELDPDMHWVRPTSILRRPLDEGKDGEEPSIEVEEVTEAPLDLNIAIKAHRLAMEDLRKISKTVLDAGIAERMLKLQEDKAQLMAAAMQGLLADLGVKVDARVLTFVRKRLTAIDATAVEVT